VVVKRNGRDVLAKELEAAFPGDSFAISTATDPYQFVEGKLSELPARASRLLLRARGRSPSSLGAPLMIRWTSTFFHPVPEIERRHAPFPTLDDRARRFWNPGHRRSTPRLRCLRALADAGLTTFRSLLLASADRRLVFGPEFARFRRGGRQEDVHRALDTRWVARSDGRSACDGSDLAVDLARIGESRGRFPRSCPDSRKNAGARGIDFETRFEFRDADFNQGSIAAQRLWVADRSPSDCPNYIRRVASLFAGRTLHAEPAETRSLDDRSWGNPHPTRPRGLFVPGQEQGPWRRSNGSPRR